MNLKTTATLTNGQKVRGHFVTNYTDCGCPAFVSTDGMVYAWSDIVFLFVTEGSSKGGKAAGGETARANGRKGGRPRKQS